MNKTVNLVRDSILLIKSILWIKSSWSSFDADLPKVSFLVVNFIASLWARIVKNTE